MLFYFTLEIFDNVADLAFTKTLVALSSSIPPAAPDIELYVVIQILLMIETFIEVPRATLFFVDGQMPVLSVPPVQLRQM